MKFSILIILYLACKSFASPLTTTTALERHPREFDLLANTKNRITEIVTNIGNAAEQARTSVETFKNGVAESSTKFRVRVNNEVGKLRASASDLVDIVLELIDEAGDGITECVDTARDELNETIAETLCDVLTCGEEIATDALDLIQSVLDLLLGSSNFAARTLDELQGCYNTSSNIITLARCVGSLAVKAEINSTSYFAKNALLVGRVNFALLALPARLESCAGGGLLGAGIDIANIVRELLICIPTAIVDALSESD